MKTPGCADLAWHLPDPGALHHLSTQDSFYSGKEGKNLKAPHVIWFEKEKKNNTAEVGRSVQIYWINGHRDSEK